MRAVTATCELLQEAENFAWDSLSLLMHPTSVEPAGEKGNLSLSAGRMGRYQAILDNPVSLKMVSPASLLPESDSAALKHDCAEINNDVYSSRIDLQDHPLEEADQTLCADGSSYVAKGNRKAGYTVVTLEGIVEVKASLLGTSAQKAELIASMRWIWELSHKKRVDMYTDSR